MLVIDETMNGVTMEVYEGTDVIVELPSNPSTGYDWRLVRTDRTFGGPVSTEYVVDDPEAIGSSGMTRMTWKTQGYLSMLGEHTVMLEYVRPWEEDVEPEKTFTFTVIIVDIVEDSGAAVLTQDMDGSTVDVNKGDNIIVRLPGNPSTGYGWHVYYTDRSFGYPSSENFVPDEPEAIGGGGMMELTWRTDGYFANVGQHDVLLVYSRDGDLDNFENIFSFTANIK